MKERSVVVHGESVQTVLEEEPQVELNHLLEIRATKQVYEIL